MILWCDGAHAARENMRRDAALLAAAEAGAEPVLRLFAFAPPGITLGMSQDPARELDLGRCAADGVEWVARPTGGRAIFHAEEWTYSLAAPRHHPDWNGSLAEAYARASGLIVRSLVRLGVPAELAAAREPRAETATAGGGAAPPCFASTARHEIVLGGRKLVGSAQRRTARGLLQQGSVLLGSGHLRIADYLSGDPALRERVRDGLRAATATAAPWLGKTPPLERWADALRAELGAGTRVVSGAEAAIRLTVPASHSYTAAPPG